jgi:PAS domain S-box-containing protein
MVVEGVPERAVIDALPRAVAVTDADGIIRLFNRPATALLGWTEDEVVGRFVTEVVVPFTDRAAAEAVLLAAAAGEQWQGPATLLCRDGREQRVALYERPVVVDGEPRYWLWAFEDVSEQRAAERRLTDLAERLHLALDAGGFGTWRWDMPTGRTHWDVRLEELFGLEPGTFDGTFEGWVKGLHPDDRDQAMAAVDAAVASKGSYVVQHRTVWPDGTVRWLEGRGAVTLDEDGEVTGTIGCCGDVTERILATEELEVAVEALRQAAEAERVNAERLEFLVAINDAVGEAVDTTSLATNVAFSAVPRLGDWCTVAILPEGGAPHPDVAVAHVDPAMVAYAEELQRRFPFDPNAETGVAGVLRTGVPELIVEIDDALIDDADVPDEAKDVVRALALRSSIIVPIRVGPRVLGAMQFVNSGTSRRYTDEDLSLAEVVGERVGAAIENIRLTERLHRDRFRNALDALLDHVSIARAVRDDRGDIVDFTIEFMNAGSIDGAGRRADELVGRRVLEVYPQWRSSGMFEAFKEVVETREPLVRERERYDDVTSDGRSISGWWTLQVVPFENGYLAATRDETAAVLFEHELRQAREDQQRTRMAVELLQAATLPDELPSSVGLDLAVRYEPARPDMPVGGDWYDVFDIPGRDAVGVVVADVAGHGDEAARTMVQVRNTVRAFALEGDPPEMVLHRANAVFSAGPPGRPFVTCCYLVVEGRGRARWACAGHFPPVLRREGTATWLDQPTGLPLGVRSRASFEKAATDLQPGDLLMLFTDGLVERRGEHLDIGIDRLLGALAGAADGSAEATLSEVVRQLAEGHRSEDDLAVVALAIPTVGQGEIP